MLFVFSKQISVTSRSVRVKGRKGDVLALPPAVVARIECQQRKQIRVWAESGSIICASVKG